MEVCKIEEIGARNEWIQPGSEHGRLMEVIITMGRERRDYAAVINDTEIKHLIESNSRPLDPVIFTDGSVLRGEKSSWGFVVYVEGRKIHSASGAIRRTTSSIRMEVEAVSRALEWVTYARPQATHLVIVTDSQSALKKIQKGHLRKEWWDIIQRTAVMAIKWIFCPGHSGVMGNEEADRIAGNASTYGTASWDRVEVLRALEQHFRAEEDRQDEDHHALARMKEMGVERGEGRRSRLAGRERCVANQIRTGTISRKTLHTMMLRGTEHLWTCPMCHDVVVQNKN